MAAKDRASLRINSELLKSVLQLAFKEKRSFNQMVEILVEEALFNRKKQVKK